ncbi:MAG: DUF2520 domain-containing protein [Sarcina ventriculi]|nr:DUF2520 domain-containing protein [Sarcina ventriculi]MDO4401573.1 DUF2520 domain-containing protein [Clostridiaceae bacterium]
MKIGFIGAGKVGFSLGKYLAENNITVSGYYSKNENSSKEASMFTNTKQFLNLKDLVNESDAIFITTQDSFISLIWNRLKDLNIDGKIICHCSGSLSSSIFSNIDKYGAYGYSIHPLFAISDKYNSYKILNEAFIAIEGHKKYLSDFEMLFKSLGNNVQVISKENKVLYHAAAVTSSNLVLGLIKDGIDYLVKCGFSEKSAMEALYPLISFNISNVKDKGITNSLTGPIERGDLSTVKEHLSVIDSSNVESYKMLSKKILDIAKIKNKDRDYKVIENYLEE